MRGSAMNYSAGEIGLCQVGFECPTPTQITENPGQRPGFSVRVKPKGKLSNLTASPSAKGSSSAFSTSNDTSLLSPEYQDITTSLSSYR